MGSKRLARSATVLAVVSAAVHLLLVSQAQSPAAAGVLVAMALGCLTCAPALWRGGSLHSWMTMLGLSGAMLFAHWQLCFACGPEVHASAGRSGFAVLALLLMVVENLVAATAVVRTLQHPNPTTREVVPS